MTTATFELAPPLQTSAPHQREDVWSPTYDLTCNKPKHMADLQWNRVSNMEPSGPEAETLPLGHRGPNVTSNACGDGTLETLPLVELCWGHAWTEKTISHNTSPHADTTVLISTVLLSYSWKFRLPQVPFMHIH
ncbi:hypothetical protein AVEN_89404-1 [Araneus ventricosus]|uniref:Uncharacterized protein n=1 Tax=Araneus ventricosus TaxID=182803 RepID=A0A4Y2TS23_ARAVE|nr:hypothetical protein AVEN_89404-1 [Araneus ventricosus]